MGDALSVPFIVSWYNKVFFITISVQNVKPNAKHACRQRLLGKNLEML